MIKNSVLFPFIFAVYLPVTLLAFNVDQVEISAVLRPIILVILFSLLMYIVFWLAFKNWHKAGLGTSLILILFFSYGHVYNLLRDQPIAGFEFGRHRILIFAIGLILVGGLYLIWKKTSSPEKATPVLNMIAFALLILPLYQIFSFYLEDVSEISIASETQINPIAPLQDEGLPDIYYIVLDSYGRQDILESIYQHDNAQFINKLNDLGFFVADQSRSNYSQTTLSLSSSLNMDYVQTFIESIDEDNLDKEPLRKAFKNNRVRELLEAMGYTTIAFDSTLRETQIKDADEFLSWDNEEKMNEDLGITLTNIGAITPFEMIFIESSVGVIITNMASQCITLQNQADKADNNFNADRSLACRMAGWIIPQLNYPYTNLRNNILYTFEELSNLGSMNAPRFVFVHMIAPHFPFVFGPNGEFSYQTKAFSLNEGDGFVGNRQTYMDGYTDELIYINKRLIETVEKILVNSENPPIIIIQADHGAHANMVPGDPDPLPVPFYEERFAILNAYYLSNCDNNQLYAGITPVNTFRVVFNTCFGQDFPLLEDISYFSKYSSPYKFLDVTQEITDNQ
jgi:hypothetical protein